MSNLPKTGGILSVVSMLVAAEEITIFTQEGGMYKLNDESPYHVGKITEFLTPLLTGSNIVELNLTDFFLLTQGTLNLKDEFEDAGIITVSVIGGKEVEGVFFPKKPTVSVKTEDGDDVEIEDIDNLTDHMERAAEDKSPSVINFLKRLAPMIAKRKHSGDDLMKFIKLSELPLTNDGCVLAYKRVKDNQNKDTQKEFPYVDCHSGQIYQKIGSRVTMEVDLVDSNRHNSCSTGLHVANLGYMKGFGGNNIMIVLVKPEDFIAVPSNDASKARVCSYDIIGVMNARSYKLAASSHQVTADADLDALISSAVDGNQIKPVVEIFAGQREVLKVVNLKTGKPVSKAKPKVTKPSSGKPLAKKTTKGTAPTASSKNVTKKALAMKTKKTNSKSLTIAEQCAALYAKFIKGDMTAFAELVKTKKAKKKSWAALGFSIGQIQRIEKAIREVS